MAIQKKLLAEKWAERWKELCKGTGQPAWDWEKSEWSLTREIEVSGDLGKGDYLHASVTSGIFCDGGRQTVYIFRDGSRLSVPLPSLERATELPTDLMLSPLVLRPEEGKMYRTLAEFWADNFAAAHRGTEQGHSDDSENSVMQQICDVSRRFDVEGRGEADGYFHRFEDGSAWDDKTGKTYTAGEFRKLLRTREGEKVVVLPEEEE